MEPTDPSAGREVERDGCGKRRLKWNDPQDWLIYENAHEPLVDPDTFEQARRIMGERGDRRTATGFLTGKAKVSQYLLSGLISCGACGGSMHGRTTWKNKWRKDGSRIGTAYHVCGAAIAKGKSVCQPIQFPQRVFDDLVLDLVEQRIEVFLGTRGQAKLRGLMKDRLGKLCIERQGIENRLRELEQAPASAPNPEVLVDAILAGLAGLADARALFEHTAPWRNASVSYGPSWRISRSMENPAAAS
jgi:hypothetical protein